MVIWPLSKEDNAASPSGSSSVKDTGRPVEPMLPPDGRRSERETGVEIGLRWVGFAAGTVLTLGTVIAVMKTLIVPRRSWSMLSASIGRNGFRIFHAVAVRLPTYDLADRLLGFLAPTVIIGILGGLLGSFVVAFSLMLLPWADLTIGDALREAGSSVFTLGFVSTPEVVPTTLDILAGATGMIFVALTIGYLPSLYSEVKKRERQVKQLEGWIGTPPWGPEVLSRLSLAGALGLLPGLYRSWDIWCAEVAESHMKYPVLPHFRLPRSGSHWLTSLVAMMDAAALDLTLRPSEDGSSARLLLRQGVGCLRDVAYPMRRVRSSASGPGIDRDEFEKALTRMNASGFPIDRPADEAWEDFAALRSGYAPLAYDLAFWIIAAPAPWSGERDGFPGLEAWPKMPGSWSISD